MNKALRLIAILIFTCAMASCTKENDPSNESNGGNGTGQINYTLGYYHPAKKIKTIVLFDSNTECSKIEFIWDGDNLSFIIVREAANIDTVHYEYNSEGRISCIWDSTGINNYHRVTYSYHANRVEVHNIVHAGHYNLENDTWSSDTYLSPILEIDYSVDYDHANNPLKDLIWYDFIDYGFMWGDPIAHNHDGRSLHNKTKSGNEDYRYDYDNDNYPTVCWRLLTNYYGNPVDRKFYSISYYPMGGNSGYGSYNGHDYVDLGLPSGTLWATCNVGADTPESSGYRFAWGETSPKNTYNWNNYKYCNNGDCNQLTKYCRFTYEGYNGFIDNLITLQPDDDAATVNWGNGWRTPNKKECLELLDYTTYKEITRYNEKGWLVTGTNGNTIFMPSVYDGELQGRYWSSSCHEGLSSIEAGYLHPTSNNVFTEDRCYGFPIRPVYKPSGSRGTLSQKAL